MRQVRQISGLNRSYGALASATLGVVVVVGLIFGAFYVFNGLQTGALNALGRAAVILFLAVSGSLAVALLTRSPKNFGESVASTTRLRKSTIFIALATLILALAFTIWHGFSAGVALAAQQGVVHTNWFTTAVSGTALGVVTSPDSFLSGWLATIGIAGLAILIVRFFVNRRSNRATGSTSWGIYTVLITTGVMAHLLLI